MKKEEKEKTMNAIRLVDSVLGLETKKPEANVIGADSNVFNLIGICEKALKKVGQYKEAEEMKKKVFASGSYDDALCIMSDYCEFV